MPPYLGFVDLEPKRSIKEITLVIPENFLKILFAEIIFVPPGHAFDSCIFLSIDSENFRVTMLLW